MEKKTPAKETPAEAVSPYQQSIQKFTEQIMDVPLYAPKDVKPVSDFMEKKTPETREEVKQSSAAAPVIEVTAHTSPSVPASEGPQPRQPISAGSCVEIKTYEDEKKILVGERTRS